jgi:hypothetical protein
MMMPRPYEQVVALLAEFPDLMISKELASVLRWRVKTVFAKAGELKSIKCGGSRRFPKWAVIEYICRQNGWPIPVTVTGRIQ